MKNRGTRHINIPIFIPHIGCRNQCVFCDQKCISGVRNFDVQAAEIEMSKAIATTSEQDEVEIAFFGGSFTGIDRNLMLHMLDCAQSYIDKKKAVGIRMSTRPDYIDKEILELLSRYTINAVELGIQSMSDEVLSLCKRGHTSKQSEKACALLRAYGFLFVGQMMVGLPGASLQDEKRTAEKICEMGACAARIYPTVVLRGTELAERMEKGIYQPLSGEEAVERSAEVLEIFVKHQVPVIRIGLCAAENLNSENVCGGEYHEAVGEMVESRLMLKRLDEVLSKRDPKDYIGKSMLIYVPLGFSSKMAGHKKRNTMQIIDEYRVKNVKIVEKDAIKEYNLEVVL